MDWSLLLDRTLWLAFGILIGHALTRAQHAEAEIMEVEQELGMKPKTVKKRRGLRLNATSAGMLLVVLITAYAAFQSQRAANDVSRAVAIRADIAQCTQDTITEVTTALDQRTAASAASNQANADLQRAQRRFLDAVSRPGDGDNQPELAAYRGALDRYLRETRRYARTAEVNPYPDPQKYLDCVDRAGASED